MDDVADQVAGRGDPADGQVGAKLDAAGAAGLGCEGFFEGGTAGFDEEVLRSKVLRSKILRSKILRFAQDDRGALARPGTYNVIPGLTGDLLRDRAPVILIF